MEFLEKVCTSNNYNINRKSILIPLARSLDIDHTKFKNRKLLIEAIQHKCPASKRCENSEDFITLCPIDDIPKNRLFIWSQNNKTFGADILSLKNYIDSGKTMNPWTIDYATGIAESTDRENYLSTFDMKNQKGLLDKINTAFLKIEDTIEKPQMEEFFFSHKIRFDIELIGDKVNQYVTHIINSIEKCDSRIYLYSVSDTLQMCIDYFVLHNDIQVVSLLEQVFIQNEIMKFHIGLPGLTTEGQIPENISLFLQLLNVFESQKENIYTEGIIKYFFLEFEESLKNYNLL